jgi:cell fate (sporulation/competence/biofilm development) regulator YmcA (YheA/YmcA/DUF963 family)
MNPIVQWVLQRECIVRLRWLHGLYQKREKSWVENEVLNERIRKAKAAYRKARVTLTQFGRHRAGKLTHMTFKKLEI